MVSREDSELLNVYDEGGRVVGSRRRSEAKASGLAVGAVMVLLVNRKSEVLLQKRSPDKENGNLWDKSVGGHVLAGEELDVAAVRETGEELFDDGRSPRVHLAANDPDLVARARNTDLRSDVVLRRVAIQHNLRDVRHTPAGNLRNVLYHVGMYLGRADVPVGSFQPQAAEVLGLRYVPFREIDRWLVTGQLAPNMAFMWLALGWRVQRLAAETRP